MRNFPPPLQHEKTFIFCAKNKKLIKLIKSIRTTKNYLRLRKKIQKILKIKTTTNSIKSDILLLILKMQLNANNEKNNQTQKPKNNTKLKKINKIFTRY